jgi:hypothetical protein
MRIPEPGFRIYENIIDKDQCDAVVEALKNSDVIKSRAVG